MLHRNGMLLSQCPVSRIKATVGRPYIRPREPEQPEHAGAPGQTHAVKARAVRIVRVRVLGRLFLGDFATSACRHGTEPGTPHVVAITVAHPISSTRNRASQYR